MDRSLMSTNKVIRTDTTTNRPSIANPTTNVTTVAPQSATPPLQIIQASSNHLAQLKRDPDHLEHLLIPRDHSTISKKDGITMITTISSKSNINALEAAGGVQIAVLQSGTSQARVYMYGNTMICFILNANELASARLIIDEKDQDIENNDYYTQARCVLYAELKDKTVHFKNVKKSGKKHMFDFAENLMIFVSSLVLDFTQEISSTIDDLDEEETTNDTHDKKRKQSSLFKRNENNFYRDMLRSILCHETRFYVYAFYDVVCRIDVKKIDDAIKLLATALSSWMETDLITEEQRIKIVELILNHMKFCKNDQGSCYRLFNLDKKIIPTELLRDSIETELQEKVQTMLKMKEEEARREILTRYGATQPITDVEWCPELEAIFSISKSEDSSEVSPRLKPYSGLLAHNVHIYLKGHAGSANKIITDRDERFIEILNHSRAQEENVKFLDYCSSDEDSPSTSIRNIIVQNRTQGLLSSIEKTIEKNDFDEFFVKIEDLFQNHFTDWKKSSNSAIPAPIRKFMTDLMTQYLFAVKTVELVVSFRVYPLLPAHQSSLCQYRETSGSVDKFFSVENTISKEIIKHNEYKEKVVKKLSEEQKQRPYTTSGRKQDTVQSSFASTLCKLNKQKYGKKQSPKDDVLHALFTDRPPSDQLVPKNLTGYKIDFLDNTSEDKCYWLIQNKNQSFCTIPIRDDLKHIIESSKYGYNISCFAQCLMNGDSFGNCVPLSKEAKVILEENTSKLPRTKIILPTHITHTQTFVTHVYNEQGFQGYIEKLNTRLFRNEKFLRFNIFLNMFENCTSTEKIKTMDVTHNWIPCWHMDSDDVQMLLHQFGPFGLAFKTNTNDEVICAPSGGNKKMMECKNDKDHFLECLEKQKCTGSVTTVFKDYMEQNHFDDMPLHDIQRVLGSILIRTRPYNFIKRDAAHLGLNVLLLALCKELHFENETEIQLYPKQQFQYLFLENKSEVVENQDDVLSLYIIFIYSCVYTAYNLRSHFEHVNSFKIDKLDLKNLERPDILKNSLLRMIQSDLKIKFPDCEYIDVITPDFLEKHSTILIPTKQEIENVYDDVYDWLYHRKHGSVPAARAAVNFGKIRELACEILEDEKKSLGAGASGT